LPNVIINRLTGSGPTYTAITYSTNRADAADVANDVSTYPIQIPASGTNYSYWVTTQLDCTVAPPTLIDNLIWYTGGSDPFGTGVDCVTLFTPVNTYTQATGMSGVTGDPLSGLGSVQEVFANYTSGTPLSVTGSTSGTGYFGYYVVYQVTVAPGASAGVVAGAATFTWGYDYF
jgi:hypothetical protein